MAKYFQKSADGIYYAELQKITSSSAVAEFMDEWRDLSDTDTVFRGIFDVDKMGIVPGFEEKAIIFGGLSKMRPNVEGDKMAFCSTSKAKKIFFESISIVSGRSKVFKAFSNTEEAIQWLKK